MPLRHVFVYGTLRPEGDAFEPLLSAVAMDVADAVLDDHALYGDGLPYPLVAPEPGRRVVGALIEIESGSIEETLDRLDAYEGEAYRRATVEATAGDERIECHVYLAAPHVPLSDGHRIPSGDWMRR